MEFHHPGLQLLCLGISVIKYYAVVVTNAIHMLVCFEIVSKNTEFVGSNINILADDQMSSMELTSLFNKPVASIVLPVFCLHHLHISGRFQGQYPTTGQSADTYISDHLCNPVGVIYSFVALMVQESLYRWLMAFPWVRVHVLALGGSADMTIWQSPHL